MRRGSSTTWRGIPADASNPGPKVLGKATLAEGIATRASSPQDVYELKALTCGFAPPAGFEPAPYGLEVRHHPSA